MKHLLTIALTLTLLTCCTTPARREAMRHGLDSINMRNRNDQPFTTADVQPYVDFFDRHGTANDRLLAHYLMGAPIRSHAAIYLKSQHQSPERPLWQARQLKGFGKRAKQNGVESLAERP